MSSVGLVILAAGGSARLGTPKQLLRCADSSLLRRAAQCGVASSCRPVVVVLGASADPCRRELDDLPVVAVENAAWEEGMGASIRVGVQTLLSGCSDTLEAVVLMLCDQPLLTPQTLEALVAEYRASACQAVASEYGGAWGVPALFDRSLFPDLLSLTGAEGAKQILRRAGNVHTIPFADGAVDIDTAADYAQWGGP